MNKSKIITVIGVIIIVSLSMVSASGFYTISQSISVVEQQKKNVEDYLNDVNNNLSVVNSQISNVNNEISQVVENLEENISVLEMLESGKRYEIHDPTYSDVIKFLNNDNTNEKPYDDETFNCADFAQEVNNNAEEQGIRCAYVGVNLSCGIPHACVAFDTTDNGIVYYEPQSDEKVNLEIGKDYWADCIVVSPGYYYERDPDWIIEDFTLYW